MFNWNPIFNLALVVLLYGLGPVLATIAVRFSSSARCRWALIGICLIYSIFPLLLFAVPASFASHFGCTTEHLYFVCPAKPWLGNLMPWSYISPYLTLMTFPSGTLGCLGLGFSLIVKKTGKSDPGFYRSRQHKIIAGVCAGIAQRTKFHLLGVRIFMVAFSILLCPVVPLFYFWMWLSFPLKSSANDK